MTLIFSFEKLKTGRTRGVIVASLTLHRQEIEGKFFTGRLRFQLLGNRLLGLLNKACRTTASQVLIQIVELLK